MQQNNNPYQAPQASIIDHTADNTTLNLASKGQRFGTYLIDIICFYIVSFCVGLFLSLIGASGFLAEGQNPIMQFLFSIAILFIYYVPQETLWGQTVGKRVMKTKAVTNDNTPINAGQAFLRTLCRFIPFEALSTFGTQPWHDSLSKTKVITLSK